VNPFSLKNTIYRTFKLITTLLICISFTVACYGQADTIYYDREQKKTTKATAAYYRVYQKDGEVYRFKSYYLNDSLQMIGTLSSIEPEIKHGYFKEYDLTAHLIFKGAYRRNRLDGVVWTYERNTGKPIMQMTYMDGISNGLVANYNGSDSISSTGMSANSYKDGEWTHYYYNSNKVRASFNYINGRKHGRFSWFYKSGNKMSEGTYTKGKQTGHYISYYNSPGVISQKLFFLESGLADGISQEFDSATGKVIKEGMYLNGKKDGKWNYFYPDGKKKGFEEFKNDALHGEMELFYTSGKLFLSTNFKFGVISGKNVCYYADGRKCFEGEFVGPKAYGVYIFYDSASRKPLYKGEMMEGKKVGTWYYFDPGTDVVIRKEQYENGKLGGNFFAYYRNGDKKVEGKFKEGKHTGKWNYFYQGTGNRWSKVSYGEDGFLTGELLVYYEDGELKRREVYVNGKITETRCYTSEGIDTAYTPVQTEAIFGGDVSTFIGKELKYPPIAKMQGIEGKVKVEFVVEEDGSISGATVIESLNNECDKEALRIINAMPKWIPAQMDGQAFSSTVTVPVVFWIPDKAED
jgi:TonB family protein